MRHLLVTGLVVLLTLAVAGETFAQRGGGRGRGQSGNRGRWYGQQSNASNQLSLAQQYQMQMRYRDGRCLANSGGLALDGTASPNSYGGQAAFGQCPFGNQPGAMGQSGMQNRYGMQRRGGGYGRGTGLGNGMGDARQQTPIAPAPQ